MTGAANAGTRASCARRARPENAIQSDIVGYLRLVLPSKDYIVYANANAARRTMVGRKASNGVPGLLPGVPDLSIVGPAGRVFYIEVKSKDGRLSPAQDAIILRFVTMGVPYVVARSIDDVKAALSQWKIATRDAAPIASLDHEAQQ